MPCPEQFAPRETQLGASKMSLPNDSQPPHRACALSTAAVATPNAAPRTSRSLIDLHFSMFASSHPLEGAR
jgi:hypothetical protein